MPNHLWKRRQFIIGLIFTAGCFVSIGRAAEVPKPVVEWFENLWKSATSERSAQLAREAAVHVRSGRFSDAAALLKQAGETERSAAGGEAQKGSALKFEEGASLLRMRRLHEFLGDRPLPSLSFEEALSRLPPEMSQVIVPLGEVWTGVHAINFVQPPVEKFAREFFMGATESRAHLANRSAGDGLFSLLWDLTPLQKRVAIVGSSADEPLVDQMRAKLEAQGFQVFFYKFCSSRPGVLCDSKTVGAYFATAGHAFLVNTDTAALSPFIPYEIAAFQRIGKGEALFVMFTPADIAQAAKQGVKTVTVLVIRAGVMPLANRQQ